jgi:hypothetical protein
VSIEGLIVSVILLTITLLLVALPLLQHETTFTADAARLGKQRERLLAYYERVLTNLRDLDEDHATGKMPDADYALEREEWVQRGIQVLRAIDSLHDNSLITGETTDDAAVDEAIDHAIEDAIENRRRKFEQQQAHQQGQ